MFFSGICHIFHAVSRFVMPHFKMAAKFMEVLTVLPPDLGNRVRDHIRTAIAVHNFRIAVFCHPKRGSSAEEINRVQVAVCLCSPRFTLSFNLSYTSSYGAVYEQFYKSFSQLFLIFCSLFSSFGSQDEVTDSKIELTGNRHI